MSSAITILEHATEYPHIVRTPGVFGGEPHLEGHHIRVRDIIAMREIHGCPAEQIVAEHFPHVALAKVYAALAYAEDHREEIAKIAAEEEEWLRAFKNEHSAQIAADLSE